MFHQNYLAKRSKTNSITCVCRASAKTDFDENAVIGDDSFYNMLIAEPSAATDLSKDTVLTGSTSGATAKVVSFDNQRNLLKFNLIEIFRIGFACLFGNLITLNL